MLRVAATRATNRRALLAFTGALAALVMAVTVVVVVLQRQQLLSGEREDLEIEMLLLGELATEALLRSDYTTVEGLVQRWVDRHDHLTGIKAVMPNGFVLADMRKAHAAREPLTVSQDVVFDGRVLMTLHAVADFSKKEGGFAVIVVQAMVVALVLILLLSQVLWWTLKRTALQPLELQIRQREEKEHELLRRTADLEAALKELESFSYSVSHDLRGPLRAIDGFSHALIEDYGAVLDDNARGYIARTRAASQRMGLIIDDMLELSRMTRREMVVGDVDLSALVHDTLARLAQAEPDRRVETEVAEGIRARGDASLLAIVIDNLLRNAWKYTARTEVARISFGVARQGEQTVYCVRDNGAGFDMAYVGKLFQPFQRLHSAQEYPGTGIGLATVARIIHRHAGQIWAEGAPGQGASLYFTLGT
jgi:signal transduction histidine kinase